MLCFRKLSATKSLSVRGKYQNFSKTVCCLTVAKNFVGESFCAVFQRNVGNEKFNDQSEISIFFKEGLLSRSTEKLGRLILLCCVPESCRQRKVLSITGKYHDFLKKASCLIVPENLVVDSFCAVFQKIIGNKKLWIRGEYQYFPEKVCCLTVLNNFVGEPFSVSLN